MKVNKKSDNINLQDYEKFYSALKEKGLDPLLNENSIYKNLPEFSKFVNLLQKFEKSLIKFSNFPLTIVDLERNSADQNSNDKPFPDNGQIYLKVGSIENNAHISYHINPLSIEIPTKQYLLISRIDKKNKKYLGNSIFSGWENLSEISVITKVAEPIFIHSEKCPKNYISNVMSDLGGFLDFIIGSENPKVFFGFNSNFCNLMLNAPYNEIPQFAKLYFENTENYSFQRALSLVDFKKDSLTKILENFWF